MTQDHEGHGSTRLMGWRDVFALLRIQPCAPEKLPDRIRGALDAKYGLYSKQAVRFGMRILETVVAFPDHMQEKRVLRRLKMALYSIAESGVNTIITGEYFRFPDILAQFALAPPDRSRLLRRNAGKMALHALGKDPAGKTAALYASRISPEFDDAVRCLLPKTRHLAIRCAYRTEEYKRALLEEYGISILTNETAFKGADVHLLFDNTEQIPATRNDSTIISLGSQTLGPQTLGPQTSSFSGRLFTDAEFEWPVRLGDPTGYPQRDLTAALFASGAIDPGELNITHLM